LAEVNPTVSFTELPEAKRRDLVLFIALGQVLEDDAGLSVTDVMSPKEEAQLVEIAEVLSDSSATDVAAFELANAMFREVLDRLLEPETEVPPPDTE